MKTLTVKKRDGRSVTFDRAKIALALEKASSATGEFQEEEAQRLSAIVEKIVHQMIKQEALVQVEQIQDVVEQVLMAGGHFKTAKAYILYRAEHTKIRHMETEIGVENDLQLSINQLKVIEKRFLLHDEQGQVIETPAGMFRRVARTLARVEKSKKKAWEDKFYEVMTKMEFLPAGRTLNNAGTQQNQLASCFVLPIHDSMEDIFDAVKWTALVQRTGGGTGFSFSEIRPRGDSVTKSSGGFATGPVSFMKVFDVATRQVMQGGKLRGANMGILSADHPDILEFISCKTEEGEISNFNISIGASDTFMSAVEKDREFVLRNPRTQNPVQTINAKMLMDQIVSLAWRTGDPGMIFWDTINENNPLRESQGRITATNPCGEQPLHPFDACNLGSINLSRFYVQEGKDQIDWKRLEEVTRVAVRMLDNVISACSYPLPQIADTVRQNRRIGLGIMGWADLLLQLGIPYNSIEGVKMAEKVMKHIQRVSWDESEVLAKEKGEFPRWKESWFAKGYEPTTHRYENKKSPRKFRNVAITTIAPTGTISMAGECSSGIEPLFALSYIKNVVSESGLTYVNSHFESALRERVGSNGRFHELVSQIAKSGSAQTVDGVPQELKRVFVTAHDIDWEWHVKMQAAFQKYTDNAVSKTINMPADASIDEVRGAYLLAWKMGCKGITVYRDSSKAGQVLQASHEKASHEKTSREDESNKKRTTPLIQSKIVSIPLAQRKDFSELVKTVVDAESISYEHDETCPECGEVMQSMEGCSLCASCGYSKCKL
ncbi:MAG: Ribonucleoside-diphosphate reductase [Microgenomates group bacterium GW2011_GWF2_45_18]|nr:MAG: Ribonucleoside-diphosphate reductase [Microgenomates group bacterium GW2011_GWF1_44_10]KKU01601.1 MAG: Ribonucleoside-diphosphate reductase [Microgenomates group bacterium GW2011_GWF2_45_18]HAU99518.1 adenosylcobalamin-dependent ribonucleoside-diphosphate reductase [Candidatus Paceibacterota bacterium]HAX01329.1 adenosylcobalamin-dependent ribonucleoside-diphosphate reductase [Candidatus Paceibacterota bacterium]